MMGTMEARRSTVGGEEPADAVTTSQCPNRCSRDLVKMKALGQQV